MLALVSLAFAQAPVNPAEVRIPLAYPPGTPAGNVAKFLGRTELRASHRPGPDDARPLEVASCPEKVDPVAFPTAFAAIRRGFAAAALEPKVEGGTIMLVATGPAPEKGPFLLVRPTPPDEAMRAAAASVGAAVEPIAGGAVVIATVDRRREVEQALCPAR